MAHFAHYVTRRVVEVAYESPADPWYAAHQPEGQGLDRPSYHVTRASRGPASRIEVGDTIWLFAQITSPWGRLPPALDAKIVVADVQRLDGPGGAGFCFRAATASRWYPLWDGSRYLSALHTRSRARADPVPLLENFHSVGQALRSIRELADPGPVHSLEAEIDARPCSFVSYRLVDGTRCAFEQVRRCLSAGQAVFWDRWSLPRRVAERREFLRDEVLDRHIAGQIRRAQVVYGIASPRYAEPGSYSSREHRAALEHGTLRMMPCDPQRTPNASPGAAGD